ncbi:iron-containing alcohol dehydrogenase [Plantactinospora sp. B6F1]|uniref:iron-containing alcohol dehydrogenase n=1 Tax=Plantactinospora sp. B6F1 TaxID=3158971 RepID=UPI00102ACAD2
MFELRIPTTIVFGAGRLADVGKLTRHHGRHALVVTGRAAMRRHGVTDRVTGLLRDAGVRATVFAGVRPNPHAEEVDAAVALVRRHACDVVVGLGGGSAIDAAKAVAVGVNHAASGPLVGRTLDPEPGSLPVVAVPTTAGSGSEISRGAIVTDTARNLRAGIRGEDLYPAVAVIDPDLVATVPGRTVADAGFDAMAHAIEGYVARSANPVSQVLAERAILLLAEHLPALSAGRSDRAVREGCCLAALLGGVNVATVGTCLPHRLQHAMASVAPDVSHGRGLAALYPAWLRHAEPFATGRFRRLAGLLSAPDVHHGVAEIRRVLGLTERLRDLAVTPGDIPAVVDAVRGNVDNDPIEGDAAEVIRGILTES